MNIILLIVVIRRKLLFLPVLIHKNHGIHHPNNNNNNNHPQPTTAILFFLRQTRTRHQTLNLPGLFYHHLHHPYLPRLPPPTAVSLTCPSLRYNPVYNPLYNRYKPWMPKPCWVCDAPTTTLLQRHVRPLRQRLRLLLLQLLVILLLLPPSEEEEEPASAKGTFLLVQCMLVLLW